MKLSVVVPVYNSEDTINTLVYSLLNILKQYDLEVVLVNDGSNDNSEIICENIALKQSRVKFISLRKNSGEHNAVICGLNFCTGDYVAVIDDDLQNPPSEILTLLHKAIEKDFDVVYSRYEVKKHSSFRNVCSMISNLFAKYLIDKPSGLYLSSFKVMNMELVKEIILYKGPFTHIDSLILRCTNNIGSELVLHEDRKHGKSSYTVKKLVSLYLNMFINFSFKPIRVVTIFGLFMSLFSFIMVGYILYEKLFLDNITPGWAFLAIVLLFSSGLMFIAIGLLGEYIGRILMSVNNTPQFTIKKKLNIHDREVNMPENAIAARYGR